jgi:hypothetical protein
VTWEDIDEACAECDHSALRHARFERRCLAEGCDCARMVARVQIIDLFPEPRPMLDLIQGGAQ